MQFSRNIFLRLIYLPRKQRICAVIQQICIRLLTINILLCRRKNNQLAKVLPIGWCYDQATGRIRWRQKPELPRIQSDVELITKLVLYLIYERNACWSVYGCKLNTHTHRHTDTHTDKPNLANIKVKRHLTWLTSYPKTVSIAGHKPRTFILIWYNRCRIKHNPPIWWAAYRRIKTYPPH